MSVHSTSLRFQAARSATSNPAWLEEEFPSGPRCAGPSRSDVVSRSAGKALDALGICQRSLKPLSVRHSTVLSAPLDTSRKASELANRVCSQTSTKFEMPASLRDSPPVISSDKILTFPDSKVGFVAQIELAQCLWNTNRAQLFGLHGTLAGIEFAGTSMSESLLPEQVDRFMQARRLTSPELRKAYIKGLSICAEGEEHHHEEGLGDSLKAVGSYLTAHTTHHKFGKSSGVGVELSAGIEHKLSAGASIEGAIISGAAHTGAITFCDAVVPGSGLAIVASGVVTSLEPMVEAMEKRCAGMVEADLVEAADCFQSVAIAKTVVAPAKGIQWGVHHLLVVPLEQGGHAVLDAIKDPIPKAFK